MHLSYLLMALSRLSIVFSELLRVLSAFLTVPSWLSMTFSCTFLDLPMFSSLLAAFSLALSALCLNVQEIFFRCAVCCVLLFSLRSLFLTYSTTSCRAPLASCRGQSPSDDSEVLDIQCLHGMWSSFAFLYKAEPFLMAVKSLMFNAFLAAVQAAIQADFFPLADFFLDTTLPLWF